MGCIKECSTCKWWWPINMVGYSVYGECDNKDSLWFTYITYDDNDECLYWEEGKCENRENY